jgi:hypothetical protein
MHMILVWVTFVIGTKSIKIMLAYIENLQVAT